MNVSSRSTFLWTHKDIPLLFFRYIHLFDSTTYFITCHCHNVLVRLSCSIDCSSIIENVYRKREEKTFELVFSGFATAHYTCVSLSLSLCVCERVSVSFLMLDFVEKFHTILHFVTQTLYGFRCAWSHAFEQQPHDFAVDQTEPSSFQIDFFVVVSVLCCCFYHWTWLFKRTKELYFIYNLSKFQFFHIVVCVCCVYFVLE